jgi:hypothetical protein
MIVKYRSRLQGLPVDVREGLAEVSYQIGMTPSARKARCIDVLKNHNIPFNDVGTGTNRFIIRYDGYVIKIALDREGVADNRQEWVMSSMLAPDVAPAHEISKGGHLLVASYAPAFSSYQEFLAYRKEIVNILRKWGARYLLGDVGVTAINYANWGMLMGKPVCIDYAYIFPVSMDIFTCICGCKHMEFTDDSFTKYKCANMDCKMEYTDRELRSKISQDERIRLFENVSQNAIEMTDSVKEVEVDNRLIDMEVDPDLPDPVQTTFNVIQQFGYPTLKE